VFSKNALSKLKEVIDGKDITVISDDIYAKLVYDGSFTLIPKIGFDETIIINGFSKSQALTGWRVGYAIAPKPLADAMTSILSHTMSNAALPSQYAALAALSKGDQPPLETLGTLSSQRQMVDDILSSAKNLSYHLPGGAFYFFLDLRKVTDNSAKWCEELLDKTGVALVPGEAFSAPGFARLSFVTDEPTLKRGLELIRDYINGKA
jgi:aspartate aminotransferase